MTRKMAIAVACVLLTSFVGGAVGSVTDAANAERASQLRAQSLSADGQSLDRSFDVDWAFAENATVGGTTTVTAAVTNPNAESATQNVTLRTGHGGEVVARKSVSVPANDTATVRFVVHMSEELVREYAGEEELNVSGWNFFTVQTRQHGAPAWYFLQNASQGTERRS